MTIIFMEKKLYILLVPNNIYQKQKTESVYLIQKNNYGLFSEIGIFQNFSHTATENSRKLMTEKRCHPMHNRVLRIDRVQFSECS